MMNFMKNVFACMTGIILLVAICSLILWILKRKEEKKMKVTVDKSVSAMKDMADKVRNHGKTPVAAPETDLNQ